MPQPDLTADAEFVESQMDRRRSTGRVSGLDQGLARRISGLGLARFPGGLETRSDSGDRVLAVSRRVRSTGALLIPYWPGEVVASDNPCAAFWRPG